MLKERLGEAIKNKKNDITSFIWKGPKEIINGTHYQESVKMIDMSLNELQEKYDYCYQMLYNKDKINPGRYVLLDNIYEQILKCNTELFYRWLKSEVKRDRFAFVMELRQLIDSNKDVISDLSSVKISELATNIPNEFSNIPIDMILAGGLDGLGKFESKHITLKFILKQGLWFSSEDMKELAEEDSTGGVRDRVQVVKERLSLKNHELHLNPKGLDYTQFRAMIQLRSKKYSELTSDQLRVLRNRILFSLADDCRFHISQWESRRDQLRSVAASKGYKLSE